MRNHLLFFAGMSMLAGCSAPNAQSSTDLGLAMSVAAIAESAYAAQPSANPNTVAELTRLLSVAQTALAAWQTSPSSSQQTVASAAIAALVAYEASARAGS